MGIKPVVNLQRRNLLSGNAKNSPFRLPWVAKGEFATREEQFLQSCTQCGECVSHCPEKIIKKGRGNYPEVDFTQGECTFCEVCVDKCMSVSFLPNKKPKNAWNSAISINKECLASNDIYCKSCQDHCETQAISFKFIDNAIPKPVLDPSMCTTCGACLSSCPQSAITLNNAE